MRKLKPVYFKSISFRVGVTLLVVIVIAELIAGAIWFQANEESKKENITSTMLNISSAASETYNYFKSLPVNYRHLILNQLREAGGTRFFISINNTYVPNENIAGYNFTHWLSELTEKELKNKMASAKNIRVSITRREDIRVFNSGIKLDELPEIWTKYSLVLGELNLPILVMQIEMSDQEWFYIASVLPVPFSSLSTQFLDQRQLIFLGITSILLMLGTAWILQREIRPVKSLAKAATLMGSQLVVTEIKEEGSKETRAAVHAFNKMNRRVRAYIRDREMLFSAISHDLKTPLACLKLRTEMLDDDNTKKRFEKLLNEVDLMLKGALQCIRETDIHEESEWIDISQLIGTCVEYYNRESLRITLNSPPEVRYVGKPVAIKRCVYNLVDNAVLYGGKVDISVSDSDDCLEITIRDYGPGIENKLLEKVFEPYFRAEQLDVHGSGLGLTISRSIARSHGGDLKLNNHPCQGLEAHLILSREV
ncbi:Integral membrane sensor signal transduction histidine kinase, glucose catabolism cluster [Photobacterium marinum]|uniref:histidine kinase n=1 Tax=Photobacterium marinum TaxID=1056511 RepID=L8J7Y9_9GAMM|nr:ATP-binding protein [Photobacterium marinum]ELR63582.1 Integral membrane sensor signal transduction histidine kinase, glucose catabolism cluster [Photobacterium marinum]